MSIFQTIADLAVAALVLVIAIYCLPRSPLRRAVERWLDRRIDSRFDKDLESYRHQLAMDAERIRAEHQQRLHNAALVIERRHEIFRELFRVTHLAGGATQHLFGVRESPTFRDHSREDIQRLLDTWQVPSLVKEGILARSDQGSAIDQLRDVMRMVEIGDADRRYREA